MDNLNTEKRIKEFWTFVEKNNRLPNFKEKEESSLYQWCQRVLAAKVYTSDSLSAVLEEIKRLRHNKREKMTEEKIREFWDFVDKNDRLPKKSVKDEQALYDWVYKVKYNVRHLADRFPEVSEKIGSIRERGIAGNGKFPKVQEFWEFVNTHGRLPKKINEGEKQLYYLCVYISRNNKRKKLIYPQVWEKMRELGWLSQKEKNVKKEQDFCEYVNKHGRIPLPGEKNCCLMKGLYYSLKNNISNARDNYPKAWAIVKDKGNILSSGKRNLARDFFKFIEEYGHVPNRKEDVSLYHWCIRMDLNKDGIREKYPEAWKKLQELGIPRRRKVTDGEERVRQFFYFVDKHGRLPEWNMEGERSLYNWCARVISNGTYPDIVSKLKEMGWEYKTLNETMESLAQFVEKHQRLPKWNVKEERSLCLKYNILKQNKKGERERFIEVWRRISKYGQIETYGEKLQKELSSFVTKYGRLPEHKDTDYRKLYNWCLKLINNPELRKKYPEATDILSEFGWL